MRLQPEPWQVSRGWAVAAGGGESPRAFPGLWRGANGAAGRERPISRPSYGTSAGLSLRAIFRVGGRCSFRASAAAIHAAEDVAAAREKARQVVAKLRDHRLTKAAELVDSGIEETLAYYGFPEEHWRRIRTNNPLERILREIRRRTRVVGAFPDGESALNLAAARLRHVAGTEWSTKRYLSMEFLQGQQALPTTA